jgi:hypothetical protein
MRSYFFPCKSSKHEKNPFLILPPATTSSRIGFLPVLPFHSEFLRAVAGFSKKNLVFF